MSNVVAITTYSNPDLLWIYLDQLSASPLRNQFKYRLFTEPGYDKEINEVIKHFSFLDISLKVRERHPECPLTGFHNILESYRDAIQEADEYIILGEDDLIPVTGYLEFNDQVYRKFLSKYERIFCVGHKRRPENEKFGDPNILIADYQMTSPSCVSVKAVEKYLLPHLTDELYNEPTGYYFKYFRDSRVPWHSFSHHDCFIERIMWKNKLFGLRPDQAISGHLGLRGIHSKGLAPTGTLEQRIAQYKELMKDGNKLRSLSSMPADMVVAPNWDQKFGDLEIDAQRNLAKASLWFYDTENDFKNYIND
jgi:hypothetical protein